MLIKLDCREIKLLQLLTALLPENAEIKLSSENLPLGDSILCDDAGNEKVIIERKSLADLASSIRDGRYKEQSFRLNQCELHNHQIYYLIEGDLRYYKPFKGMPDKKALLSAMVSMSYFKGFSIVRTINLEETAEWIAHFAGKLQKEGPNAMPFYSIANGIANSNSNTNTVENYAEVISKRVKSENITPANIGEIMLAQIPGVSTNAAAAIMQEYKTMADLLLALQSGPHSLNAISTTNKNGQKRKITKPSINAIYDFLVKPLVINLAP